MRILSPFADRPKGPVCIDSYKILLAQLLPWKKWGIPTKAGARYSHCTTRLPHVDLHHVIFVPISICTGMDCAQPRPLVRRPRTSLHYGSYDAQANSCATWCLTTRNACTFVVKVVIEVKCVVLHKCTRVERIAKCRSVCDAVDVDSREGRVVVCCAEQRCKALRCSVQAVCSEAGVRTRTYTGTSRGTRARAGAGANGLSEHDLRRFDAAPLGILRIGSRRWKDPFLSKCSVASPQQIVEKNVTLTVSPEPACITVETSVV